MKHILSTLALILLTTSVQAQLVHTAVKQGEIEGVCENGLAHYKGIPFAEPPVGELRWKAPLQAKAWDGTFKADHFAKKPYQQGRDKGISEDCLYLNVLTPAKSKDEQLPVLVWIHGGGFATGESFGQNGDNFAKAGIVYVSITYRLNAFGFLSLPALTKENKKLTGRATSGNYGLMDQILALQWVHDNISAFGGDPDKVTIMGESAGAISVAMLCQSPMAKGLFRGAISESGGNMVPCEYTRVFNNSMRNQAGSDAYGQAYIQRLGLGKKSLKELRKVDPAVFMNDSAAFSAGGALWPVYDDYVLTPDAYQQYEAGNYNDVNVLIGTNSDEGSMFSGFLGSITEADYQREMTESFEPEWRERFMQMYPGSTPQERFDAHSDIFREAAFAWPTYAWGNIQSKRTKENKGQGKVYMYHFDQLKTNPFRRGQLTSRKNISTHAFELSFTFGHSWGPMDELDKAESRLMMRYWINFIKTGNPNDDTLPLWTEYAKDTESVMYFRDGAHLTGMPNITQLKLWEEYMQWRREKAEIWRR